MTQASPAVAGMREASADRWGIDLARSSVAFTIRHLMVATVHGAFKHFAADLEFAGVGLVRAAGAVETNSIVAGDEKRDEVLLGPRLDALSRLVKAMRATEQTAHYIERIGPFFAGRRSGHTIQG